LPRVDKAKSYPGIALLLPCGFCYLDLGLVWPELSRNGQETVLRQAPETAPSSKLLWSSDGHHLPEPYWLAVKQAREAVERVICEYVKMGDMSFEDAEEVVKALFFENANWSYNLGLTADWK
jgi:hypothetical protein